MTIKGFPFSFTLDYIQGCCLRLSPFPQAGKTNVYTVFGGVDGVKEFARYFYSSKAWQRTRTAYAKSKRNLCEVCLSKGIVKPGEIVHHKIHLTPENISDPSITLDWNNLQLVCRDCHAAIHDKRQRRYKIDDYGRVIVRE